MATENESEILLELAKIELAEARGYEAQRERLLGGATVITVAVLAAVFTNLDQYGLNLSISLAATMLNIWVSLTSLKFYAMFKERYSRYQLYRDRLGERMTTFSISEVLNEASRLEAEKTRYQLVKNIRGHTIWTYLPVFLALLTGTSSMNFLAAFF